MWRDGENREGVARARFWHARTHTDTHHVDDVKEVAQQETVTLQTLGGPVPGHGRHLVAQDVVGML